MTKAELVEKIYAKAGFDTKGQVEKALSATIEALRESLKAGESVTLTGFGTFKVVQRAERKGHNPRTKEDIIIPACNVVKFTPGKQLKEDIQ